MHMLSKETMNDAADIHWQRLFRVSAVREKYRCALKHIVVYARRAEPDEGFQAANGRNRDSDIQDVFLHQAKKHTINTSMSPMFSSR
jgi:hypothetical protein